MGLQTILLGLLVAAAPSESDFERPCVKGSPEARQGEVLLASVARAQQSLEAGAPTAPFVAAMERIQNHRCFAWPSTGWPDFEAADALQLREWWSAGGERWLRSFLDYDPRKRTVLVAPGLRTRLGVETWSLMKRHACGPAPSACAAGDAWRARMTAALQSAGGPGRAVVADCSREVDRGPNAYAHWIWCQEESLGRSIELPIDQVNPPTRGWLVVRDRSGAGPREAGCRVASAYALETGDSWSINSCEGAGTRVGRVPVVPLRELALLLLMGDGIQSNVRAQALSVALPPGLEPRWYGLLGRVTGLIGCGAIEPHYTPARSWRVVLEDGELLGTQLTEDAAPLTRVTSQWLEALESQRVEGCPTVRVPDQLFRSPDPRAARDWEPPHRERKTYAQLEALMRSIPEGCSEAAAKQKTDQTIAQPKP